MSAPFIVQCWTFTCSALRWRQGCLMVLKHSKFYFSDTDLIRYQQITMLECIFFKIKSNLYSCSLFAAIILSAKYESFSAYTKRNKTNVLCLTSPDTTVIQCDVGGVCVIITQPKCVWNQNRCDSICYCSQACSYVFWHCRLTSDRSALGTDLDTQTMHTSRFSERNIKTSGVHVAFFPLI